MFDYDDLVGSAEEVALRKIAFVASGGMAIDGASLTVLIVVGLVVVVAITALLRARPEDVPKVFDSFVRIFGSISRITGGRDTGGRETDQSVAGKEVAVKGSPAKEMTTSKRRGLRR